MYPRIKDRVYGPSVGLIVAGVMSGLSGLAQLLLASRRSMYGIEALYYRDESYRMGYRLGYISSLVAAFLSLILAPVIIYGASRMMKLTNFKLSRAAAVLALIPCTSCCFLVGIPMGIWALIVLNKPEIRQAFDRPDQPYQPPDSYGWS